MCSDLKYILKKISFNYKYRFVFVLYLFQKYTGINLKTQSQCWQVQKRWESWVGWASLGPTGVQWGFGQEWRFTKYGPQSAYRLLSVLWMGDKFNQR